MSGDQADLKVQAQITPQPRDIAGRFRKIDLQADLDRMVDEWGRKALQMLREATPVEQLGAAEGYEIQRWHPKPGTARDQWRVDHVPGQNAIRVSNKSKYLPFHVTGTTTPITPKNDMPGFLFFYDKAVGHPVRRRWVHGIPPYPPLVAALERVADMAAMDFKETGISILHKLEGTP